MQIPSQGVARVSTSGQTVKVDWNDTLTVSQLPEKIESRSHIDQSGPVVHVPAERTPDNSVKAAVTSRWQTQARYSSQAHTTHATWPIPTLSTANPPHSRQRFFRQDYEFVERVATVELGAARGNTQPGEIWELKELFRWAGEVGNENHRRDGERVKVERWNLW